MHKEPDVCLARKRQRRERSPKVRARRQWRDCRGAEDGNERAPEVSLGHWETDGAKKSETNLAVVKKLHKI